MATRDLTTIPPPSSRIDGCPSCVVNSEPPTSWLGPPEDCVCAYLCTDCGHRWITSWRG